MLLVNAQATGELPKEVSRKFWPGALEQSGEGGGTETLVEGRVACGRNSFDERNVE